ncbi:MAG: NADH-quinone oxidoreductase subunit J [Bdellovibrionaceae bacterium]|nr:NADH-quinone oxidoreductase subunit J [Pseudobdellovibrionaceae bacterium]
MLELADYTFYFLAALVLISGIAVITAQNPIFSALWLALTMIGVAGIFVSLDAWFVAGVQLIVYAGAVMVLFVMVIMLFDLRHEIHAFSRGILSGFLKLASAGIVLGLIVGTVYRSAETVFAPPPVETDKMADVTKALANTLFTKYIFSFEVIGVLLLVIAIGAVTLSRIRGGTHASHD